MAKTAFWYLHVVYALVAALLLASRGADVPWEVALIAAAAIAGRRLGDKGFWVEILLPFAILLLAYRALNGFAGGLSHEQVNIVNLIVWEKALFGGVNPPAWLQARLFGLWITPLLDVASNLLYVSHFIAPITAAALVRSWRRPVFWRYLLAFFTLAYLGFVTYILFPAAPPWWATRFGYLTGPDTVSLTHFIISPEAMFRTPNPLAAMPSMHCAYPLFIALGCLSIWGRRVWPLFMLPLGVGWAVVYLGHHYVIDAVVGYAYAAAVWLVARHWLKIPDNGAGTE